MEPEDRPPDLDADYRVVHGAWPHWMLQLSLVKLALRTAGVVLGLMALGVGLVLVVRAFS